MDAVVGIREQEDLVVRERLQERGLIHAIKGTHDIVLAYAAAQL